MKQIPNQTVDTLLRHLPRVLGAVDTRANNRLAESVRLLTIALHRLSRTATTDTRK